MIFGISTRWKEPPEKMDVFKDLEFVKKNNCNLYALNFDMTFLWGLSDDDFIKLKKQAKDISLVVRFPHHLNTASEDPILFEKVKHLIKVAKLVNSEYIIIYPGNIHNKLETDILEAIKNKGKTREEFNFTKKDVDKLLNIQIYNLIKINDLAKKSGLKVALENNSEDYQFGSNLEEFKELVDSADLFVSLSTGHANLNAGSEKYVEIFKDKIINLTAHDNDGTKDRHLALGKGNINFKKIIKRLPHINILIDCPYDDALLESIKYLS